MKLLQINNYNTTSTMPAFKGLKSMGISHYTGVEDIRSRIDTYHPFKDELAKNYEKFLGFSRTEGWVPSAYDDVSVELATYEVHTKLGNVLPFNENLWKSYLKNKYLMNQTDRDLVENGLKDNNLHEYLYSSLFKRIKAWFINTKAQKAAPKKLA